jgi:hypothetical protein
MLGVSAVTDHAGHDGVSNTTIHRVSPGMLVFAAGTVQWGLALVVQRLLDDPHTVGKTHPLPGLQRLTANALAVLIQRSSR